MKRINSPFSSEPKKRKKRKQIHHGYARAALAKVWEIFDYPCGQRLAPLLKSEVDRLRKLGKHLIPMVADAIVFPSHKLRYILSHCGRHWLTCLFL